MWENLVFIMSNNYAKFCCGILKQRKGAKLGMQIGVSIGEGARKKSSQVAEKLEVMKHESTLSPGCYCIVPQTRAHLV